MLDISKGKHNIKLFFPEKLRLAVLAAIVGAFLAPVAVLSDPLPLSKLEDSLASSLRLKAAGTQIDYAHHLLRQEQAREGAQISGRLDVGHHQQIVTNSLTRNYSALQPGISLSYPLLGGRARQLEATKAAQMQIRLNSIDFDDMRRQLLHQLRSQYILYWQYSQAEQLTARHLDTLGGEAPAASKMHEKGMWTDSEYLHFNSEVAAAKDELQGFRTQQRIAMNTMHSILGRSIGDFQPVLPDLPQLCLSSTALNQSAERHATEVMKLGAQREALLYNRDISAGSSVNADIHLGVSYIEEFADSRQGYAATAGVSISMPAGFQEAERANKDRLDAAIMVNRTLDEQARLDLQLTAAQAYENFMLALNRLEVRKTQTKTAHEALRETRMQFDRLPHPVFNELIQKTSQEYLSSLAEIESQSLLLQKTADLLLLAPDSCMETGKL